MAAPFRVGILNDMSDGPPGPGRNIEQWLRLAVDEVIALMTKGKVLPYLDIPFQHASPEILKAMKRPAAQEKTLARIKKWREQCPELTLRSTFIVGFPGETADDRDKSAIALGNGSSDPRILLRVARAKDAPGRNQWNRGLCATLRGALSTMRVRPTMKR